MAPQWNAITNPVAFTTAFIETEYFSVFKRKKIIKKKQIGGRQIKVKPN